MFDAKWMQEAQSFLSSVETNSNDFLLLVKNRCISFIV